MPTMHAQFLVLSGPDRGEVATYDARVVRIGSDPSMDLTLPDAPGVAGHHADVEFHENECCFYLRPRDGDVFVDGKQMREVILDHGDLLEFGLGGPKARFRIHADKGAFCKPVHKMLADAHEVREIHGIGAFLRSLAVDMHRRTSLGTKILVPVLLAGITFLASYLVTQRSVRPLDVAHREQRADYERKIAELRAQLDQFRKSQDTLVSRDEVAKLRVEFEQRASVVDSLLKSNAALKQVLDEYSRGVCLVHGVFGYRILRDGKIQELADDSGDPVRVEYVGSGFRVSAKGHVVTNRHVAEPWWKSPQTEFGFEGYFVMLEVVFPGQMPIRVDPKSIRLRNDEIDVAVLQVDAGDTPVLPMFDGDPRNLRGDRVVVLGYPTGVNALLAKAEPEVLREVLANASDLTGVIAELARRNAITPVATQGALNEVFDKQMVYDASTTQGGSGGPVFGVAGTVIGVNFAILAQFGGSNFGVPIRFAAELLPKE